MVSKLTACRFHAEGARHVYTPLVRILLVEDSERVTAVVIAALKAAGHEVAPTSTCAAALAQLDEASFDLAIVDVGLPDGSGLDVCRHARRSGFDLPILMLTARNGVGDRVSGLDAGADDYLGKPFATAELNARVRALARRGPRWTESLRVFGAITVDRDRREVRGSCGEVAMTPREFEIIALLAWSDCRVVTRAHLLEAIWGEDTDSASASLEVLIARIRRKLTTSGAPEAIRTIRQVGYAWNLARSKQA